MTRTWCKDDSKKLYIAYIKNSSDDCILQSLTAYTTSMAIAEQYIYQYNYLDMSIAEIECSELPDDGGEDGVRRITQKILDDACAILESESLLRPSLSLEYDYDVIVPYYVEPFCEDVPVEKLVTGEYSTKNIFYATERQISINDDYGGFCDMNMEILDMVQSAFQALLATAKYIKVDGLKGWLAFIYQKYFRRWVLCSYTDLDSMDDDNRKKLGIPSTEECPYYGLWDVCNSSLIMRRTYLYQTAPDKPYKPDIIKLKELEDG